MFLSRSDEMILAVGFNPRAGEEDIYVASRRLILDEGLKPRSGCRRFIYVATRRLILAVGFNPRNVHKQ